MKRVVEVLGWLTAVALFAFASHAVLARQSGAPREGGGPRPQAVIVLTPGVSQDVDAKPERRTRERRSRDGEEARDREDVTPASITRSARTIFVRETRHLDKKYLEYKLQKYRELQEWGLMLVEDEGAADLVISFDKTALNYIFTITDPRTSIIVTSGKAVAINSRLAAEYLGKEIIKKIRDARAGPDPKPRRKRNRDDFDPDEESESR